jgi:5-methylcytosine-specific restriction endonuclease McrBC regulatory subunit McrC
MQNRLSISLIERGQPHVVSLEDWTLSNCAIEASELVKRGIIKLVSSGNFVLLEPKTLVGAFTSPRLRLEIKPKFSSLSSALAEMLDVWRRQVKQDSLVKTGLDARQASLWRTFEALLLQVHKEGLPWSYKTCSEETSTPKGRILFRETVTKLHSRGITHRVFSKKQVKDYFGQMASTLDTVRRKLALLEIPTRENEQNISRLIELTGDRYLMVSEYQATSILNTLLEFPHRPALKKLVEFCCQLLGNSETYRVSERIGSGVAEFVDMEKLWEHAVQMLLQLKSKYSADSIAIHPLREKSVRLFADGGPRLDPDIVIYDSGGAFAVVDAKYSSANTPSADDVYQLTCYVTRLSATIGILAYVSVDEHTRYQEIGTLSNGSKLFSCYISLSAFNSDCSIFDNILHGHTPLIQVQ